MHVFQSGSVLKRTILNRVLELLSNLGVDVSQQDEIALDVSELETLGDGGFWMKMVDERGKEGGEEVVRFPHKLTRVFVRVEELQPDNSFLDNFGIEKMIG